MSEAEREYKYKDPRGMQRLCGILMCIMGPLGVYMTTLDPAGMELEFLTLTHNQAVVFMGALGVVLIGAGAAMFAATMGKLKFRPRIAFTPESFIFAEPLFGQEEKVIAYRDITEVSTSKIKGQRYLNFTYPGGQAGICDATLKSRRAFDEISALLTKRVHESALAIPPKVPASKIKASEITASDITDLGGNRVTANIQELKGGNS